MLASFDEKPYDGKEVVTKPKAIILAPYGSQPYDNKDELTQAKSNNAFVI